jgi:uncharacterized membrane protein
MIMASAKIIATLVFIVIVSMVNRYSARAMFQAALARNIEEVFRYSRRSVAVTFAIGLLFIGAILFVH